MIFLVEHGRVVDPATGVDEVMDLLIEEGRIRARGKALQAPDGCARVDATGLLVLPGFVDMHTHTDFTLGAYPDAPARIRQGVTTDVTGNCGFSPFPSRDREYGAFFSGGPVRARASLSEFAAMLASAGTAINIAPLVGLGSVRTAVMGGATRAAERGEIEQMQDLVAQALDQGAFGASSGLVYTPGRYMAADEVAQVLRPMAGSDRLYATHLRDERDGLVEAIEEAIATAERVGVDLQVSHHKAVGRANWGRTQETLARIDAANQRGRIDVAMDYYPYVAGSTGLVSLLPTGVLAEGWPRLSERLGDPRLRAEVLDHIKRLGQFRPDEVVVGQSITQPAASGQPVVELARARGVAPEELILELLEDEGETLTMIVPAASARDLEMVAGHPRAMHGSDAWLMTVEQARHEHPRNLTSTIRILVAALTGTGIDQESGSAPGRPDGERLRRAIYQLSTAPARRLRLADRGTLAIGAWADVVIADPARASAQATLEATGRYPDLIRWVFVNGEAVLADGERTGVRAGTVLRRT